MPSLTQKVAALDKCLQEMQDKHRWIEYELCGKVSNSQYRIEAALKHIDRWSKDICKEFDALKRKIDRRMPPAKKGHSKKRR